ncbi:MAG: type II toxin-antitoxin system YafQ family toxin [Proteobacteria bacterium]|nr:type II toxin-antitoxin system YafQ family toxin [Pseudomonadota bacterium]MBU1418935.1 type II toxin-antitoxin system YafQ family toxin [Pseudomonadota bacterium]MBU1453602.1 type II toxin-antitoxin system YafQ family toxin [Pseudomonadota bacterium]
MMTLLTALINDDPLEPQYRDYDLRCYWSGYHECHVNPDLLLLYRKVDTDTLRLDHLHSHSQLFG